MFTRTKLVALIPALLLTVTSLQVGATTTAEAASTCKGDACNGKHPKKYGCDKDAKTIDEFTGYEREELRYSKKCNSAWTRYTSSRDWNTLFAQVQTRRLGDRKQIKIYGVQVHSGRGPQWRDPARPGLVAAAGCAPVSPTTGSTARRTSAPATTDRHHRGRRIARTPAR